jgi:hypothetical protein
MFYVFNIILKILAMISNIQNFIIIIIMFMKG